VSVQVYTAVNLEPVSCYSCGTIFGLSDDFYRHRKDDQKEWYCPNGHSQHFISETDAHKFKRLYEQQKDTSAALRGQLDGAENRLRATKGVVTKLRKKAITGTCAFCHRHFANMERHVATKHPTEIAEA